MGRGATTLARVTGIARGKQQSLRDRVGDWIFPPKGAEPGPVVLGQRRVYILPTGAGLMFGVTLLLMLIGSINYNLSLGYVLVFLLAGIGTVSILHTWRNLARIALQPGKAAAVFAGEFAGFRVVVDNPSAFVRFSLAVEIAGRQPVYFDLPAGSIREIEVRMPATTRGLLYPGRLRLFTTYPLGLFYAWALVDLDLHCLVYPQPEPGRVLLPTPQTSSGDGSVTGGGEEDFAGLRTFHPGDSPRRIAWKAFARSEIFLSKQFSGSAAAELWLDFDDIADALGLEKKLSRLTRWVIDSEAAGIKYGLRMPGVEYPPEIGMLHRTRCLQALALFR